MTEALRATSPAPAIADLDLGRFARRGYPEAVYGEGKTPDQLRDVARLIARAQPQAPTLFTRLDAERAAAVLDVLPTAHHVPQAGLIAWPATPPQATGGLVAVVAAGTSDVPVALEAELTATYLGRRTVLIVDVGWPGCTACSAIWRLCARHAWWWWSPAWTARCPALWPAW